MVCSAWTNKRKAVLRLNVSVIYSNDQKSQIEEVSSRKALIYRRIDILQIFAKKIEHCSMRSRYFLVLK